MKRMKKNICVWLLLAAALLLCPRQPAFAQVLGSAAGAEQETAPSAERDLEEVAASASGFDGGGMEPEDLLWAVGVAFVVAWAVTSSMMRRMRPVQTAKTARNYIVKGSYRLRGYNEIFLGRTVTKQERQESRNHGGGGPGGRG